MIVWVAALGLAMSAQTAAGEESLADKAARARKPADKASPAPPAKVFTNEDLINAKGNVIVLPAPEGEAPAEGADAAGAPAKPEPTEDEKRAQAAVALQKQIDEEVEVIRVSEAAIADWERELGDLSNYTFGGRRAALAQQIEEARRYIAEAHSKIDDLEEQARRQGIRVTVP